MLRNIGITLFLFIIVFASCKENTDNNKSLISETTKQFKKEGILHLFKSDGTKIKTIDIEIADTPFEIETDLKNRPPLTDEQGVLFIYPENELRGFFMTDIAFSLDLVFLNGGNKIVSFSENTEPLNETKFLPSQVPALSVLKINGGLSEEWILEVGDYVEIVKIR